VDRYALFVDAGYLLAAGGWACLGTQRRGEVEADCVGLAGLLQERAESFLPDKELLRVYWYDAATNRVPTSEQISVAELPDCKIRIGQLTVQGAQKGVDSMVLSDITELSRRRGIADAILLAGDGDFVDAVAQAQLEGTRVSVWGIKTPQNTVSPDLRREADRFLLLDPAEMVGFLTRRPKQIHRSAADGPITNQADRPSVATWASLSPDDAVSSGNRFARIWNSRHGPAELAKMLAVRPTVPSDCHIDLLRYTLEDSGLEWGTRLAYDSAEAMRNGFWEGLERIASEGPEA
jgi:NYN domain